MAEQSTVGISQNKLSGALRHSLKASGSLFAIGCLLASGQAYAQDDPTTTEVADDEGEVIIVTGIRASLANSQDI